jgi:hypothetical protein
MMMSLLVSNLLDHLKSPPKYEVVEKKKIQLTFKDAYELQDFIMEIRKQGVKYGLELAELSKKESKHERQRL